MKKLLREMRYPEYAGIVSVFYGMILTVSCLLMGTHRKMKKGYLKKPKKCWKKLSQKEKTVYGGVLALYVLDMTVSYRLFRYLQKKI